MTVPPLDNWYFIDNRIIILTLFVPVINIITVIITCHQHLFNCRSALYCYHLTAEAREKWQISVLTGDSAISILNQWTQGWFIWSAMPTCFQCNSAGRCRNWSCRKGGIPCDDCLPFRQGGGPNVSLPATDNVSPPTTPQKEANSDPVDAASQNATDIAQCNSDDPTSQANADALTPDVFNLASLDAMSEPNFAWGGMMGSSFCKAINSAYDEAVQWRCSSYHQGSVVRPLFTSVHAWC